MVVQRRRDKKVPDKPAESGVSTRAITLSIAGLVALFGPLYRQTYILQKELTQTQATLRSLDGASSSMATQLSAFNLNDTIKEVDNLKLSLSTAKGETEKLVNTLKNGSISAETLSSANANIKGWKEMPVPEGAPTATTNITNWEKSVPPDSDKASAHIQAWGKAEISESTAKSAGEKVAAWNTATAPVGSSKAASDHIREWANVTSPPTSTQTSSSGPSPSPPASDPR